MQGGLFRNRAAAQIKELERRQAELLDEVDGKMSGMLDRAFVQAYSASERPSGDDRE